MRKKFPYAYFLIFFSLLTLMSLPKRSVEKIRGSAIAVMTPSWKQLLAMKNSLESTTAAAEKKSALTTEQEEELQQLRLNNTLLRSEIAYLKEIMQHEMQLLTDLSATNEAPVSKETVSLIKKRHQLELQKLLQLQIQAIPARIIFRSPEAWNSSLWIDVGEIDNKKLNSTVIAKNSPVLVGNSIIGVIDYVGKKQSKVRLITDSDLTPSVRALRKSKTEENIAYLAKGEIHGSGNPLWRSKKNVLKGSGFNYDYADEEGPARDLRTGRPLDSPVNAPFIPILKVGDLLVTTGLDGVFPPDLLVAKVIKVYPLKEGDYFYELDAIPTAGDLDDLASVFVIPPISQDE